jgi:hypothetical protein
MIKLGKFCIRYTQDTIYVYEKPVNLLASDTAQHKRIQAFIYDGYTELFDSI